MKQIEQHSDAHINKGLSIDELRYRRAYALARYEMAKIRITESVDQMRNSVPTFGASGIVGKLMGSLNYLDYAVLAYKAVSKIMKLRRKK